MTNGEKIKATFPHYDIEIDEHKGYVRIFYENFYTTYPWGWWNAEYKESTTKDYLGVDYLGVDCISRSDVLQVIQDNWHIYNGDLAMQESLDDIRALPSVTPQEPRWIPVSERLSEDRREVLVTAYWHETYQVMMASYFGDGLWWCVPYNNCGEHMQRLKPKAWMPLPESYKEQNHE